MKTASLQTWTLTEGKVVQVEGGSESEVWAEIEQPELCTVARQTQFHFHESALISKVRPCKQTGLWFPLFTEISFEPATSSFDQKNKWN